MTLERVEGLTEDSDLPAIIYHSSLNHNKYIVNKATMPLTRSPPSSPLVEDGAISNLQYLS